MGGSCPEPVSDPKPMPSLSSPVSSTDPRSSYETVYCCITPFQLSLDVGSHETETDVGVRTKTWMFVTTPRGPEE